MCIYRFMFAFVCLLDKCLRACLWTCMSVCTCYDLRVCACVCVCARISAILFVCIPLMSGCVRTRVPMEVYNYVSMHVLHCVCVSVCVCVHACISVSVYVYSSFPFVCVCVFDEAVRACAHTSELSVWVYACMCYSLGVSVGVCARVFCWFSVDMCALDECVHVCLRTCLSMSVSKCMCYRLFVFCNAIIDPRGLCFLWKFRYIRVM